MEDIGYKTSAVMDLMCCRFPNGPLVAWPELYTPSVVLSWILIKTATLEMEEWKSEAHLISFVMFFTACNK